MIAQYAGEDKWRAELKIQYDLLHSLKRKGQSNYTLERFVADNTNVESRTRSVVNYVINNIMSTALTG